MAIHGIYLVKNEDDIIDLSITSHLRYIDYIYVLDNGSTDRTWEVLQGLAERFPDRVILHGVDPQPFNDSLRSTVFNAYRSRGRRGDWWCRLDADELYIDEPQSFLATVDPAYHVVWSIHFQYYLCLSEVDMTAPLIVDTKSSTTEELLPKRYITDASEARFFRHRDRLHWRPDAAWPDHMGLVAPQRIRLRHFKYRSPAQIQRRFDTRREAAATGWKHFAHAQSTDWRSAIGDGKDLRLEDPRGTLIVDSHLLPNHLESLPVRLAKRLLHGAGFWP